MKIQLRSHQAIACQGASVVLSSEGLELLLRVDLFARVILHLTEQWASREVFAVRQLISWNVRLAITKAKVSLGLLSQLDLCHMQALNVVY